MWCVPASSGCNQKVVDEVRRKGISVTDSVVEVRRKFADDAKGEMAYAT
jgi:hypothetical protein